MLEIGALGALEVLAGKCAFWRPRAGKSAGLELVSNANRLPTDTRLGIKAAIMHQRKKPRPREGTRLDV